MSRSAEVQVIEIDACTLEHRRDAVVALLADAVEDGACLGFLGPLKRAVAANWIDGCIADVAASRRFVWLALVADHVVGTVHLDLATKDNAAHRAEVQKLIVHGSAARRGIGARLMAAVEAKARALGRWLLVLDTEVGSPAVAFYERLGWRAAGVIPDYSYRPDGVPAGTQFFYRDLRGGHGDG